MHQKERCNKNTLDIIISFPTIDNACVLALVDSGSSDCFMTKAFANRYGIMLKKMKEPRSLILFDQNKSTSSIIEYAVLPTLFTSERTYDVCYLILPFQSNHQIVLGKNFLSQSKAVIDFGLSTILLPINQRTSTLNKQKQTAVLKNVISIKKDEEDFLSVIPKEYHSFIDVFSKEKADILPPHRPYDHKIILEDNVKLPFGPVYSLSHNELKALKEYLDEMLSKGFIRPSTSPAGSPVLFVKKKDGCLRLCVDYRRLNSITKKNVYPLPLINNLLDQLNSSHIYTKIDLRGAYNLVRIAEGDEYKTAFRTRYGSFEYLVMPFGLCNAPATFQHFMNDAFRDMLDQYVIIYLDDILIFSKNKEDHEQHVKSVLQRLRTHHLFAKSEKCIFHSKEVEFLGYKISEEGISMDENKVKSILSWPVPKNVKELQSFLGFSNFYRRFILGFSSITRPLHDLTKKGSTFVWSSSCQSAFQTLKSSFTTAPVLIHYDHNRKSIVESDASDTSIAAILSQFDDLNQLHPVAYFSRSLTSAERNYEVHDKELLAICAAFREWRAQLQALPHQITVITDHKSLEYFTTTKSLTRRQARWSEFLSEFNFVIKYRPGKLGLKADALSRKPDMNTASNVSTDDNNLQVLLPRERFVTLAASYVAIQNDNSIISLIKAALSQDSKAQEILSELNANKEETRKFYHLNAEGILLYKNRIYVPNDNDIKLLILKSKHDSVTAGHPGLKKTLKLLRMDFYFPSMFEFTKTYVESCYTCSRNKTSRHKAFGLLQSLPISSRPWSDLSLDFIEPLPLSDGFDSILVVVDRLTKMAILIPTKTTSSSKDLANSFIQHVIFKHGLPISLVSDRGTKFTSSFWTSICDTLNIQTRYSTAYHPQTDGQSERINQNLEQYLRIYVNYNQDNWQQLLPFAEYVYNSTPHSSTNISPFFANYGFQPTLHIDVLLARHDQAKFYAKNLNELHEFLKSEIQKSNLSAAKYHNRKRLPPPDFKMGDKVWLSTANIKLTRPMRKLSERFIGPFEIIEIISPNAVKLKLPPYLNSIHPVFNVSLLKKHRENIIPHRMQPPPPPVEIEGELEYEVEDILDYRIRNNQEQYLVKWVGYEGDEDKVTWEPRTHVEHLTTLLQKFHSSKPRRQPPITRQRVSRQRN